MRWPGSPPRLRTVLLVVNLLVLSLPLAGISLLRLYGTLLVRQTESELLVQGAVLAAAFRAEIEELALERGVELAGFGRVAEHPLERPVTAFDPALPGLDLTRQPILPPEPPGAITQQQPDPLVAAAGRRIEGLLAETQRVSLAGLRLVDAAGIVVATTRGELGLDLSRRVEVAAALRGDKGVAIRRRTEDGPRPALDSISRDSPIRVVVAYPVRTADRVWGAVALGRTPLSVRQALWRDRRLLVFGAALLILIVTLISMLVAATLTRPLRRLIAQTARVERGDAAATRPLERPGVREIEQISQAVARLSTTLQQRAEYIATFAANVSHELKTPLTALRGTVELLRDHLESMSVEERERFLSMLEKDTQRVERLGERLLDLARADVIRPGEESVALLPVVETIAERFACQGRRFHFRAEELTGITVRVGCEALDAILANLLDNAFVHGPPGVEVTLRARSVGGDAVAIEVLDDGPGIPEPLRARVFERFVTTRRNDGGTGLGLAIVASLARAHGGDVMLGREARDGRDLTVFSLRLPRA